MIRSFVVALVTIVAVSATMLPQQLAAQAGGAAQAPVSIPLEFSGGTGGVSIEIYLNAGKVGDTTLNSTGAGNSLLEMGNIGKTRVTIYVDVCKDGKIVKVMFVTGNGQAPPEDESCRRRLAAVSFQSDCGVTRINFDFTNFGARVIGCAAIFTRPQFYGPVAGAAVLLPFLIGGDDSSSTVATTPTTPQQPTVVVPVAPPTNTTSPPQPVTNFSANLTGLTTFHPLGANTSFICGILIINPMINGATWTIQASGPAVLPNQNVTGTFNNNGQAAWRIAIGNFGSYALQATVVANNVSRPATANHNVTSSGASSCPSAP